MREGRRNDEIRPIKITLHPQKFAEGSVIIEMGNTVVLCSATVIPNSVPPFLKGTGSGWITAEYSMLPRSVKERIARGKVSGRAMEIQRLIGRSLRAGVDLNAIGETTIMIDCDVIQADGGTRTASINGGFIALCLALDKLYKEKLIPTFPIKTCIGALSAGIVNGEFLLDLDAQEDMNAEVDINVVMTSNGEFVEIQGTGEKTAFSKNDLDKILSIVANGMEYVFKAQRESLLSAGIDLKP